LPKDIEQVMAMKYYENHISNACELRINGLRVAIEIKHRNYGWKKNLK